ETPRVLRRCESHRATRARRRAAAEEPSRQPRELVDARAGFEVEEVQSPGVDGEGGLLPLSGLRAPADPGDEGAAVMMRLLLDRLERLVADDLAELVGADRRCVDGEVEEYLRAHVLLDVDGDVEPASAVTVRDVLGTDAECDPAPGVLAQPRPLRGRRIGDRELVRPEARHE